jgi:hypothetical protein
LKKKKRLRSLGTIEVYWYHWKLYI